MSQKVQKIRGTDFPKTTVSRIKSKNPHSITDEIYNETGKLAYVIAKAKQRISKENYEIFEKYNECLVLDGLSGNTRHRDLTMFLLLTKFVPCEWKDIDELNLRKMVTHIMVNHAKNGQETSYTGAMKKMLKAIVRFIHTGNRNLVKHKGELEMLHFIIIKKPSDTLTREDLPTKDESDRILKVCADSTRDKAMLSVQMEAGTRIGELLYLNIKNFVIDKYGGLIKVKGKTGTRSIRIVTCVPYVTRWLNDHPDGDNMEAPLWVYMSNEGYIGNRITYAGFNKILKKRVRQAKVTKNIYSHLFRHAEVTRLASVLTEPESRMRHGWGKKSDMPSKYAHLNQEDLDDKILQNLGIKKTEVQEETMKQCTYCKISFPLEVRFCNVCSRPIDINDALGMEKESQEDTKAMMYQMIRLEKAKESKSKRGEKMKQELQDQQKELQMLKDIVNNMVNKMSKAE